MAAKLSFVICLFTLSIVSAQNSRSGGLTATGYRIPSNVITGAPGQLLILSLSGIGAKAGLPIKALPTSTGYPLEVSGVSVRMTSLPGPPVDVPIIALQQSGCAADAGGCVPISSLTLLLPDDLGPGGSRWFDSQTTLMVRDGLSIVAEYPFRAVPDNLHFLNSCDETLIWVNIFEGVPNAKECLPNFIQNGALVNGNNPIRPGGGVATYLYGGGVTVLRNDEFQRKETVQSFNLHFDYRVNAPASRPTPGVSLMGKPFLSVGFRGGLYQVNFMIPPIPEGVTLPPCDGSVIRSNLTITIAGANSFDSAAFCVEP